jgi:photosystem II stability/assembly factor-like uncharacterized protein
MPQTKHLERDRGVLVLVGTTKGAFLCASDDGRADWEIAGPYFPGQEVYALAYDAGRKRILAGAHSSHWGPTVSISDDLGRTFSTPERAPIRFPDGSELSLKQVWQIVPAGDVVYAGVEPAALFASRDGGETWSLNEGLFTHPHRKEWQPGGGGLCLHTILPLGERLYVAISTGGVYRSDDRGLSWRPRNQGIRAPFLPEGHQYPEFGQCVHKVAPDPATPGRLYLQHHWGVYRSDDAGDSWQDIGKDNGLPSDFGFACVAHPRDGGTAWVLPIEADMFRATPGARLRVYRTRDAGGSWQELADGLPQEGAYECVLRDGMAADALAPAGLYFGTRSGKLYASRDEGDSWRQLSDGLPPIVCVKTAVLG